jgi:hypothetical protein
MSEVKAEFRIGKTQWAKWGPEARMAYNRVRGLGFTHETGVAEANAVQAKGPTKADKPKRSFLDKLGDAIEDVAEVAEDVAEVAAVVSPTIAVTKTVVRATRKKKAK